MNRRKAQKHRRLIAVQDEKGKVHNDQGQQCFSLIHIHAYARIYICAKQKSRRKID
jgi:hypothetical protein